MRCRWILFLVCVIFVIICFINRNIGGYYYEWRSSDLIGTMDSSSYPFVDDDGNLFIMYPFVVGKSKKSLEINRIIFNSVNNYINDFESSSDGGCFYINIAKFGSVNGYDDFVYLDYEVKDNNGYIFIIEREVKYSCSFSSSVIRNEYVVDKKTGELVW